MTESHLARETEFDQLQTKVLGWVEEAAELRFGPAGDPRGALNSEDMNLDDLRSLDLTIRRVRFREERIDALHAKTVAARARVERLFSEADDAFTEQFARSMNITVDRKREYASAKELEAEATIGSIDERQVRSRVERLLNELREAERLLSNFSRQLSGWRQDVRALIHARQVENSLGR